MVVDNLNPETDNLDPTTEVKDWREGLDPTVKNHPSLQNFKTTGDLAKSWVEAQKLIGRDKIPVPDPNKATKEDWDLVFERLGRPKDATGYNIPEVKLPEGYPAPDKQFMEDLKAKAFELGLLPAQINNLYSWFMDYNIAEFNRYGESRIAERGEAENALRKLWGKAFEQNFQIAEQAVNKYGTEKFIEKLRATGLNNDPDMVKFIADMAKNFSEDKIAGKPTGLTLSPDEALQEIAKIKGDTKHPYWDKQHPEHEFALNKMKALFEMAHGTS